MTAEPEGSREPAAPPLRQRIATAGLVAVLILGGAFGTVLWFEADRTLRLERIAAILASFLLVLLFGLQVGLATGRVSGRVAWGGRFETLPRSQRVASAVAAPLMLVLAWVLLERAGVVDVVGNNDLIAGAAWAVTLLFLLSTVGNLASSSPPERRLGIPVATALVILSCIVAYSG
jgi:hypothetical protein